MDTMQSLFDQALRADEPLDARTFSAETAANLDGRVLECTGCHFEHCTLSDLSIDRYYFVDCSFTGCDLSGLTLQNSHISRTRFIDCRASALTVSDGILRDVAFSDCRMDYAVFSASKLKHVSMTGCALRHSVLGDLRHSDWTLADCDLTETEILRTPLQGIDLSSCTLDRLSVDPAYLRGTLVNVSQALAFAQLIGLRIKE